MPPKKRARTDEQTSHAKTPPTNQDKPTYTITYAVPNVSTLDETYRFSPKVEASGVPWKIGVNKGSNDGAGLNICLRCDIRNDSPLWSFDVSIELKLRNRDTANDVVRKFDGAFSHKGNTWRALNVEGWEDVTNPDKGFIDKDQITVEAVFTINKTTGIRTFPIFNFTDGSENKHDLTLIVDGKKLFVSKQFLCFHSPVLDRMLCGQMRESGKNEVELRDVDFEALHEAMHVVYSSGKKSITDSTAEALLSVGDYLEIKILLDQVERFLTSSSSLSVSTKLRLSGEYRLYQLQGSCLSTFTSVKDVTTIRKTDDFKNFNEQTQAALLQKIMKLADSGNFYM